MNIFEKLEEEKHKIVEGSAEIANKTSEQKPKKVVAKTKNDDEKNETVLIGRDFSGEVTKMCDINEYSGKVLVSGKIITTETKEINLVDDIQRLRINILEFCLLRLCRLDAEECYSKN